MAVLHQEGLDYSDIATYGYRNDRWNFVEGEALSGIISKLNKEQNRYQLSPHQSRVVWRTLLFYPGATVVRVTDLSWRPTPKTFYFFGLRGQYRRLEGSKNFIQFLNEKLPLKLSEQTAIEYLKFYCFFLRFSGQPFILFEKLDDLGALHNHFSAAELERLRNHLHPFKIESNPAQAQLSVSTLLVHGENVYDCLFTLNAQGRVEMINHEHVASLSQENTDLAKSSQTTTS